MKLNIKINRYNYCAPIFTLHSEYSSFIVFVGIHFCYTLFFVSWNFFPSTINLPLFSLSYPIMRLYNLLFHESRGARFVNVDSVSFTVFIFCGKHHDLKKRSSCLATYIRYFIFYAHAGASREF